MKNAVKLFTKIIFLCSYLCLLPSISFSQSLILSWTPSPESDISHYVVYRDTLPNTFRVYMNISAENTSFTDTGVEPYRTYYYKMTAVDFSGNESAATIELSATAGILTSTGEQTNIPGTFRLEQNYPNPFNPSTTIQYDIPAKGRVQRQIFNTLGMKVRTLIDDIQERGNYSVEWDGKDDNGTILATGIYFYQLMSAGQRSMKKAVFQK